MDLDALLRVLADLDITLCVAGDQIVTDAPTGAMTDFYRQEIRRHKAAILARLSPQPSAVGEKVPETPSELPGSPLLPSDHEWHTPGLERQMDEAEGIVGRERRYGRRDRLFQDAFEDGLDDDEDD